MKYTIFELKNRGGYSSAIICSTSKQAAKLSEVLGDNRAFTIMRGLKDGEKFAFYPYGSGWDRLEDATKKKDILMVPFEDVLFELPEKYTIHCKDKEESSKAIKTLFYPNGQNTEWNHWDIVVSPELSDGFDFFYSFPDKYKEFPIFEFNDWEKLINMNKTTKKGEIVGYKLKKDLPDVKAGTIGTKRPENADWIFDTYKGEWKTRRYQAEVLNNDTEFFEPVYGQEEEILIIGSKNTKVSIKKGTIKFDAFGGVQGRVRILELENLINSIGEVSIAGHTARILKDIRCIRIGCENDNNLFSINELERVRDAYLKF